jgi:hypothetical protein
MVKSEGILEDSKHLYIVMADEMLLTLDELIQRRETLTEFELKYFFT